MSWAITAPETRLRSNTSASGSTSITPYRRPAHSLRRDELNGYRFALLAHCYASGALLLCLAMSTSIPSTSLTKTTEEMRAGLLSQAGGEILSVYDRDAEALGAGDTFAGAVHV